MSKKVRGLGGKEMRVDVSKRNTTEANTAINPN
jgi:hypothetical protein